MSKKGVLDYHVLVVDDVPAFAAEVRAILSRAGMRVTTQLSPVRAAEEATRRQFDLLITTLVMREMGGFDLIRAVRAGGSDVPIVMITGYGSDAAAAEAMRLGASDYMTKPLMPEELVARVRRILPDVSSDLPSAAAQGEPPDFVTHEPVMQSVLELVRAVGGADSRVLITGETGTGKQLIARAIHHSSPRSSQPFVDVNCAAIPDTLLESELFGHEKGAFTGAERARIGRFEEAGSGTLLLDEIGEMGYGVQSKLLKVLQDGRFNRLGSSKTLQSGARVLAATNRDLEKEVREGRFRSDLFYRLQVVTIVVPPLRQRRGDILYLAQHFLRRFDKPGRPARQFTAEALATLAAYDWPGNVRELENMVERVALLTKTSLIDLADLPDRLGKQSATPPVTKSPYVGPYRLAKDAFERDYVQTMLVLGNGNMAQAARLAGIDRAQFFRLVKRQGLTPRTVETPADGG